MIVADFLPLIPKHSWMLALQMGSTNAVQCAPMCACFLF